MADQQPPVLEVPSEGIPIQVPLEPDTEVDIGTGAGLPFPEKLATDAFNATYHGLRQKKVNILTATVAASFAYLAVLIMGTLGSVVTWVLVHLGAPTAKLVIQFIGEARKELDPDVAALASEVLNELTGAEFTADDLPTGKDLQSHIERATRIGSNLVGFLEREFAPGGSLDPDQGQAAAGTFVGFSDRKSVV